MIKHKLLSLAGFATGTAMILISSPPTMFQNPSQIDEVVEREPISEPSPTATSEINPSQTPVPEPPDSPLPTTSTKAAVPVATTATLTGSTYAASKYGNVQVQIVVTNGIVTSAKALVFPNADSRSTEISAIAIPELIRQTLEAKNSADIQGATGASYTSAAWIDSLQSALAKM
jgi:uncharacterized protein with FMN-binding domain